MNNRLTTQNQSPVAGGGTDSRLAPKETPRDETNREVLPPAATSATNPAENDAEDASNTKRSTRPVLRGEGGRFLPGTGGLPGAGNPDAKRIADLRKGFLDQLRREDFTAALDVIREAMTKAPRWSDRLAAVALLFDRTFGRPAAQAPEDVEEFRQLLVSSGGPFMLLQAKNGGGQ